MENKLLQNSTLSISIISDKFMGEQPGWASLFSHQLLAIYPEINFDFRFFHIEDFSDKERFALQEKKLIGHNPHHIIFGIDRPNLNEIFFAFIERLPKKTHGDIWMLNIPKVLFGSDFDQKADVEKTVYSLKTHCTSEKFEWIDPSDFFEVYIKQQIEKEGNLHALHKGKAELTLLGQLLLCEYFKHYIKV